MWIVPVLAMLVQALWVPRLRQPQCIDEDAPPDFRPLGSWPHVTLAGVLAVLAVAAGGLGWSALPWVGYAIVGAPLVVVDLRTTYLPNELKYPLWAAVGAGVVGVAVLDPMAALGAVIGAAVAFGAFWLVWKSSESFGYGDVRLAAAVGAVAGLGGPTMWALAFVAGTALGAIATLIARARGYHVAAYGPWLWLGPVAAVWLAPAVTGS